MAEFRGISSMRMFERGKNWRARIFIKNLMIFAKFSKRKLFFQIFLRNRESKRKKGALDQSIDRTVEFLLEKKIKSS